ncbi:MAG: hypothetical protein ACI909_000740, partial [Planctomycetota bacterium]
MAAVNEPGDEDWMQQALMLASRAEQE